MENFFNPETLETLRNGWYFLMFGLMVAEGPFVTMTAAFLASFGVFNIFLVAILGWMGDTVGDIVLFYLWRFGSKLFQRNQQIDEQKKQDILKKLDNLIENHFVLALLFIKFTPYAPMVAYPYLGTRKISSIKFVFVTSFLSIPVPLAVALIGFHIEKIQYLFKIIPSQYHIPLIIFWLLLILIIIFWIIKLSPKIQNYIQNTTQKYTKNPH